MNTKKQYTIRGISRELDRHLVRSARQQGLSLNQFVLNVLTKQANLSPEAPTYHDLDRLWGSWKSEEEYRSQESEFDRVLQEQRKINEDDWK